MNQDNRNFILFAVLAALILFGWPLVIGKIFPTNPPPTKIVNGKTEPVPQPGPVPNSGGAKRAVDLVLKDSPRVRVTTPDLQGSINLKGARIDDLVLTRHRQTILKNSPPIRLFAPSGTEHAYFAEFGWSGDGITAPDADTVWKASAAELTPDQPLLLSWTNDTGQRFLIQLSVDRNYMFTVRQLVENKGTRSVTTRAYAAVSRLGAGDEQDTWTNHIGPIGTFGNGANYDITYDNLNGKEPSWYGKLFGSSGKAGDNYFSTVGGWTGFGDKYWLAALIPDQGAAVRSGFRGKKNPTDPFQADVLRDGQISGPGGGRALTTTRLFAGAKEVNVIDGYEDQYGITHFGRAIDWGWFEIVEKPIFKYLDWLFRTVGNFGLAIMLLTLTIRGLLFPIAQRQFASMAAVRAIQPKMKAIQEKYKDDKTKAQTEIMALYKQEKVNPLAGCLPTLIQIPIMYGLYKVLLLTIEMRHQPFIGWIRDLSAPDPLTPVNLFGLLPFTPPAFLAIGIIPILLGVSMYLQFKMNPAPMDEAQKQVFAIMPWVLMFVMAPFAVGLQIYWITSNLLTVAQQRFLYARHPALKQPLPKTPAKT